jgi:hypothetical protein
VLWIQWAESKFRRGAIESTKFLETICGLIPDPRSPGCVRKDLEACAIDMALSGLYIDLRRKY